MILAMRHDGSELDGILQHIYFLARHMCPTPTSPKVPPHLN